jgi:glutathione synthase
MDPPEGISVDEDTTLALGLEAQARGHKLWAIDINELMIDHAEPAGRAGKFIFKRDTPCFEWLSEKKYFKLDEFDYVLMRKDPPFDEQFFFATHILSLCRKAVVVNRPSSLRNAPEKLYALNFPQIAPPTLVTSSADMIRNFMEKSPKGIIVKPLNRCGGSGILFIDEHDKNFNSLIEMSTDEGRDYIIVQQYLPEIAEGDKRVICVNGKPYGAIARIPGEGEHRGNIHVGAKVVPYELSKRDKWLLEQIEDKLKNDGLYFTGIDIIGDYITEINVTSPTGIQEILRLGGRDIAKIFWDQLDQFVK